MDPTEKKLPVLRGRSPDPQEGRPIPEASAEDAIEDPEYIDPADMELVLEGYKQGDPATQDFIDVEFESLDPEVQEALVRLEAEYAEELAEIEHQSAKSRIEILREVGKDALEFVDLDTKGKVFVAALEIIPYVGAMYAFTGKAVRTEKNPDTGKEEIKLMDISWGTRGAYALGELLISGHIINGVGKAIAKKGL